MTHRNIKKLRRLSQAQERRTAREAGGKVQIASGAITSVGMKGDVRTGTKSVGLNDEDYLIENKMTSNNSYTLSIDTWLKIQKEATRDSLRIPILQIDIQNLSLVCVEYNILHEKFKSKNVFLSELSVKKSVVIQKRSFCELSEMCRRHGDILISKFVYEVPVALRGRTTIRKVELGIVEKKYWEW